ncbi:tripartite tricarboxylate transporter TctB family protein [Hoeflea sp.]|uniref:tripartite tricarboxylate transporter TctB family protein n=1 Tax=Hoeflea sp. TaxID=1940281 RepID=UPI003A8FEFFA
MKINDAVLGALLFLLGCSITLSAFQFPAMPGQAVGPGTFPKIIGSLIALLGLGLALGGQNRRGVLVAVADGWRDSRHGPAAALALIGTAGLAIGFEQIGFPLGASLLLCVLYFASQRNAWRLLPLAVGFVFAVHLVMTRLLLVPLPAGPLKGWL